MVERKGCGKREEEWKRRVGWKKRGRMEEGKGSGGGMVSPVDPKKQHSTSV